MPRKNPLADIFRPKRLINLTIFLFLIFVFVGDKFLPKPLNTASTNTRVTINNYLIGLFPKKRPKDPNERTEKALEQLEKKNPQ